MPKSLTFGERFSIAHGIIPERLRDYAGEDLLRWLVEGSL